MKKNLNIFLALVIFAISFSYFYYKQNPFLEVSKTYITILIFFFATITGVFIARQGRRYNLIVKGLTDFNGNLSYQYRNMEIMGKEYQNRLGEIIKNYFSHLKDDNYTWDWFIKEKSTTLTDINRLYIEIMNNQNEKLDNLEDYFLNRTQASLLDMHKIRKNLVPLVKEGIPLLQWVMIGLLATGLVISIISFDSQFIFSQSILKSLYLTSIYSVIATLYKMNKLTFYEEKPGESSAQDVLDIIEGKK